MKNKLNYELLEFHIRKVEPRAAMGIVAAIKSVPPRTNVLARKLLYVWHET